MVKDAPSPFLIAKDPAGKKITELLSQDTKKEVLLFGLLRGHCTVHRFFRGHLRDD